MLIVSDAAAETVKALTAAEEADDAGGLRISVESLDEQGASLGVALVAAPDTGDEVIVSTSGALVFLQPEAALYLADKVLDVRDGRDGGLEFAVHGKTEEPRRFDEPRSS
ncbi:iron-sulfur cluster biosynthesis protein [Amycolatopsis eburnea]|uniref:Iron-sulfur cluster biosynthesis protein n=1 Tax=Amycolatopsis eburnea TaxID=2267691 RepID=A0A3R9DVR0_9PSEU|nr:iron-sulfur cluster biosynthesis protein [Amycolatopsis eburnea]